ESSHPTTLAPLHQPFWGNRDSNRPALPHFSHLRRVIMPLDGGRRASMYAGVKTLRFPVFPRNVGMLEDGLGRRGLNPPGARGRTRTGMGLPPRDFLTTTAFAAAQSGGRRRRASTHLWSGLYLHPAARPREPCGLGGGRQVSTLSAKAIADRGLARYCSHPDVLLVHRI